MATKERARKLYKKGMSIAEIAKKLKKPYATVYNWVIRRNEKEKPKKKITKLNEYVKLLAESSLGKELEEYLFNIKSIKKQERTGSLFLFYREHQKEIKQVFGKRLGKSRFYQIVNLFISRKYGSIAKLELKRRPRSAFKYIVKAGTIKREKGLWEIDGTGFTFGENLYSILFCIDTYSGFVIDYIFVEAKEKGATHYNKAFNSQQVGLWLQKIFIEHGVPEKLRYDNEKILISEYIKNALKELKIDCKRTVPYRPNAKLIERVIGSLKSYLITSRQTNFNEALQEAIWKYNRDQHHFKHGIIRPIEHFEPGRKIEEDTIKFAFAEKFTRVLRDSVIQIDNLKYECLWYRERLGDTGRLEKGLEVLCVRYLDDVSKLEVYEKATGEFLGTAKLVSFLTLHKVSSPEIKESIAKEKRSVRRLAKLEEEATYIKGQLQPNGIVAVYSDNGNGIDRTAPKLNEKEKTEKEVLPGILEIFG